MLSEWVGDKPRLLYALSQVSMENPNLEFVKQLFNEWRNVPEYLVFKRENNQTGEIDYKVVKAAKRGNDVYNWLVKQKFSKYEEYPDVEFFNPKDRSKRQKTKAIFITLTYDRNISLDAAWLEIGKHWNTFITGLREKYGRIEAIRTWEAQQDGYPHIHALLFFWDKYFDAFFYNKHWRIQGKDKLVSTWEYGFSDVQGMPGYHGGLDYILKYIKKVHNEKEGGKSDLTLAMLWIFRKRAFSVSRSILDLIDRLMPNSKPPPTFMLIDSIGQLHNLYTWTLKGFWGGTVNGNSWSEWVPLSVYQYLTRCRSWSENVRGGDIIG